MLLIVVLALFSQTSFAQVIQADDVVKGKFKVWHPVNIKFEGPWTSETATPNPFTQYRLDVFFTSPSGKVFRVPGFYAADGKAGKTGASSGKIWKVKFPPNEPGEWSYYASFVKGNLIAAKMKGGTPAGYFDGHTGSFTINPSDVPATDKNLRGKGKLEYVGDHYLQFQGTGKSFMKGGANSPEVFLEYAGFDNTPSARTYPTHISDWNAGDPTWRGGKGKGIIGVVNYLSTTGVNGMYFLTNNHEGDGGKAWPWINTKQLYRYDCSKLQQWDFVFKHFDTKGMMLHFVTTETENESLFENIEGSAPDGFSILRKIYYRELVARFGYHLAITWNVGEENGWNEGSGHHRANTQKQRLLFAKRLKKLTYYNDHIVVHNGPSWDDAILYGLLGTQWYSGPSFQWGYNDNIHSKVNFWRYQSAQHGKKWVVSMDEAWVGPETYSLDHWRKEIVWGTIMAGGAGTEFYVGAGKDVVLQDLKRYHDYYRYSGIAVKFMQKYIPMKTLYPNDNYIGNGWTLKNNSKVLLYLRNGGTRDIDLPKGTYTVRWYDPRHGGILQVGTKSIVTGGASKNIGYAPSYHAKDWVVWIEKFVPIAAEFDGVEEKRAESEIIDTTAALPANDSDTSIN